MGIDSYPYADNDCPLELETNWKDNLLTWIKENKTKYDGWEPEVINTEDLINFINQLE